MDITFTEKPEDENPDLKETVAEDNALKEFVTLRQHSSSNQRLPDFRGNRF